ncbi:MAG: hypothetical protein ABL960_08640 [Nitrospira sp.]
MNLVVHFLRTVEVEDSSALSEAQRALTSTPSIVKQATLLKPVSHKR